MKTFKFDVQDGMLAVYEVRLGQGVNPRLYKGWRRKLIEFLIKRYFLRIDKKLD